MHQSQQIGQTLRVYVEPEQYNELAEEGGKLSLTPAPDNAQLYRSGETIPQPTEYKNDFHPVPTCVFCRYCVRAKRAGHKRCIKQSFDGSVPFAFLVHRTCAKYRAKKEVEATV